MPLQDWPIISGFRPSPPAMWIWIDEAFKMAWTVGGLESDTPRLKEGIVSLTTGDLCFKCGQSFRWYARRTIHRVAWVWFCVECDAAHPGSEELLQNCMPLKRPTYRDLYVKNIAHRKESLRLYTRLTEELGIPSPQIFHI